MEEVQNNWLTLSEAQALLGVSRKTLYRYMDKNQLQYKKAANSRRYITEQTLLNFIEQQLIRPGQIKPTAEASNKQNQPQKHPQQNYNKVETDYSVLITNIEKLSRQIDKQNKLLEVMIELYKPQNMHDILLKKGLT